jgi:transaldolase/glucose-6-phosphate isomerase
VAIANSKITYQRYKEIFSSADWSDLGKKNAQTQRVLWASTSTKDPNYSDVYYVEELIGPDTVDTIPPATFDAFRDHGKAKASLEADLDAAHDTMDTLAAVGISMKKVTDDLVTQAVKLFAEPFDKLLNTVDAKCKFVSAAQVDPQTASLPAAIAAQVQEATDDWKMAGKVRRLWGRDASLWTGSDEGSWLGWLGITEDQLAHKQHLVDLGAEIKAAGFKHALLLGMGGSSLGPEVLKMTFGKIDGFPELFVLDSTDPAQVKEFENKVDLANTIFIVSSKSGSTLEPNIFKQYFMERVKQVVGADKAASRFIAVTDPGSKFEQVAQGDGFRHIFHGLPSIGGRYSVLSDFGMVPAAVMGLDAPKFLDGADVMAIACSSCLPVEKNAGVQLGLILGVAARNGRDKVTLITSPPIWDFGAWLEQLMAESTGKEGKGLIPVDREPLGPPEAYGKDRVFAYIRTEKGFDAAQDKAVEALAKAGHPVVTIALGDIYNLGQEMFRWEIATAVAGSVIGINAFNQPDVEASKIATRKLTSEYEKNGSLPAESPFFSDGGIQLFSDDKNVAALTSAAASDKSLVGYLRAHLNRLGAGDYFALLGYVQMNEPHDKTLQSIRTAVRDKKRAATCLGFGPRFLHSTGQAYKGGPNSGVFLQVTCDDKADLAVPGQKFTFGVVKAAQARGDFTVLAERDRRALRVHLHDVDSGLATLQAAIQKALA